MTSQKTEDYFMKITKETFCSVVESLLFANPEPLSLSQILSVFDSKISKEQALKFLEIWETELEQNHRGLCLRKINKAYQLRTKAENKEYLLKMKTQKPFRLSGPSLEVLSILAYKQPCPKQEIDQIRGVDSSHLIRTLMEKELVVFAGKSDLPGKPSLYKTSQKFLEVFNLDSLKDLPSEEEISDLLPEPEQKEPENLSQVTENMSVENLHISYEEDEKENQRLKDNLKSISTTVEFLKEEKSATKKEKESASDGITRMESSGSKDNTIKKETKIINADSALSKINEEEVTDPILTTDIEEEATNPIIPNTEQEATQPIIPQSNKEPDLS